MPDSLTERFAGRILGVATMHGKEHVIGPALMEHLPLQGFSAIPDLDTDRFGAFSGEVERATDPRTACILKARHGAEASGMDLVIASEGSFGPYPAAPFMSCDEEWLVLVDLRDDRVMTYRHVSLGTLFGGGSCHTMEEVMSFARRMKFPEHHLVLKTREHWQAGDTVTKGIDKEARLRSEAARFLRTNGAVWVETDMRAMANPTRMKVIGEAAKGFAQELARRCPQCGLFHFAVTKALWGLPCGICGFPTKSTRAYLRECTGCGHRVEEMRPDDRSAEDPQYCELCNP